MANETQSEFTTDTANSEEMYNKLDELSDDEFMDQVDDISFEDNSESQDEEEVEDEDTEDTDDNLGDGDYDDESDDESADESSDPAQEEDDDQDEYEDEQVDDQPNDEGQEDYETAKKFYEEITGTEYKSRGRKLRVRDAEHAKALIHKGFDYSKKMEALKPHRRTVKTLEKEGLLDDPERLNVLLEANAGNPNAIKKLLS